MKKSQILGLSVALAGNMALMMPQTASAVVTCNATTTTTGTSTCSGSGGYTQENVDFESSKGVAVDAVDDTTDFSACAYHLSGAKSFGMSTSTTTMSILSTTGGTATSGVGCS
jgi:hypothetical protein